jgi:hypothetical protein
MFYMSLPQRLALAGVLSAFAVFVSLWALV